MTTTLTAGGPTLARFLLEVHARRVCHEAGHAVAKGRRILEFTVPFDAFTGEDLDYPYVTHTVLGEASPLVTFAGPWAGAKFEAEMGEGDLESLLEHALEETDEPGGDLQKLEAPGFDPLWSPPMEWGGGTGGSLASDPGGDRLLPRTRRADHRCGVRDPGPRLTPPQPPPGPSGPGGGFGVFGVTLP